MTGIETVSELQNKLAVPLMIFSAFGEGLLVQETVGKGALVYLVKPLDVPHIIPTIETALEPATELSKLTDSEFHHNRALHHRHPDPAADSDY